MNTSGRRAQRLGQRLFPGARAATLCAIACATHLVGCAGHATPPDTTADRYVGPPIHLEDDPSGQVIVVESPSGGWAITLDGVYDAFERRDAFVTIMRPNPLGLHTQAIVEQRLATFVPAGTTLRVLARTVPYSVKVDKEQPYSVAPISPTQAN